MVGKKKKGKKKKKEFAIDPGYLVYNSASLTI